MPTLSIRRALVLLATAVAVLAFALSATAAGRYPDSRGDARPTDIRGVSVTSTASGQISFRVELNAFDTKSGRCGGMNLDVDADANPRTGNPLGNAGAEYLLSCNPQTNALELDRWSSTGWQVTQMSTGTVTNDAASMTFAINRSELGSTKELNFYVIHGAATASDRDRAPNHGTYSYSLGLQGPAVKAVSISTRPRRLQAGRRFSVARVSLRIGSRSAPAVQADSYRCRAAVGGKALRKAGPGACTFAIPAAASGLRLHLIVTYRYEGGRYRVRRSLRIE